MFAQHLEVQQYVLFFSYNVCLGSSPQEDMISWLLSCAIKSPTKLWILWFGKWFYVKIPLFIMIIPSKGSAGPFTHLCPQDHSSSDRVYWIIFECRQQNFCGALFVLTHRVVGKCGTFYCWQRDPSPTESSDIS